MKVCGVLPIRKDKNVLLLAMLDPKNIQTLSKIKSLTGCAIAPLFILENEFNEVFDKIFLRAKG